MDKKQEPQMYICPKVEECTNISKGQHYMRDCLPHKRWKGCDCSTCGDFESGCECTPYVAPSSPAKVCTNEGAQEICLHITPSEEDCAGCPDFKAPQPEPEMPHQEGEQAIVDSYAQWVADKTSTYYSSEASSEAHDQQVRREVIMEIEGYVKGLLLPVSNVIRENQGWNNAVRDILSHLRAMAGGRQSDDI